MRRFAALLVLTTALACGGDSSTSSSIDVPVPGTYTLRMVNRKSLPFTVIKNDSVTFDITSDAYTLNEDRSFTEAGTTRTNFKGDVTTNVLADTGSYVLSGTKITLISAKGSTDGTIGGGTLTLANDAVLAVYQK
jgi:hypothetical protein